MARETKVGLLAGLAFIVCFAVILTSSGPRDPLPGSSRVADASRRAAPAHTTRSLPRDMAPDGVRPAAPTTRRSATPAQPTVRFGEPASPASNGPRPAGPEWRRPLPINEYEPPARPASQDMTGADQIRTPSTSLSSLPPDAANDGTPVRSATAMPDDTVRGAFHDNNHNPQEAATTPQAARTTEPVRTEPARRAVLAKYTVMPGDTLTRIAAKHYGHGARRYVDAIVDANRSTITNPDVLRAGMNLTIPSLEANATSRPEPSERRTSAHGGQASSTSGVQYRWYQIKKNDRYISIARNELGDASRWEEIYELNKEKFPDPGAIREGVRIKLPLERSASAEHRR